MAPISRNSSRKQQSVIKSNKNKRKEVSFTKRETLKLNNSGLAAKPRENYENLILYYLTKLKGLFANPNHPTNGTREHGGEKMRRELQIKEKNAKSKLDINPNRFVSRESTPKPRFLVQDNEIRDKIYDVVSAAIEYGYKNNIIEKKGNYFQLRNKRNPKLANRQPTPGPSETGKSFYVGCNCSRCKAMNSQADAFEQESRPMTSKSVYYDSRPAMESELRGSPSISPFTNMDPSGVVKSKSCTFGVANACPLKERPQRSCCCKKCLLAADKKRKMMS